VSSQQRKGLSLRDVLLVQEVFILLEPNGTSEAHLISVNLYPHTNMERLGIRRFLAARLTLLQTLPVSFTIHQDCTVKRRPTGSLLSELSKTIST